MNKILLSALMLIIAFGGNARQISVQEALSKATQFEKSIEKDTHLNSQKKDESRVLTLEYVEKNLDNNLYYVFNQGENQGFIIVSGDDRANEILGYADEGTFDINNLPENMKGWLEVYSHELKQLSTTPDVGSERVVYYDTKDYATKVSPLLGNIAWNQNSPYNDLCPVLQDNTKAPSGCVATAISQVMYYHKWPERGEGSHSYTTETRKFELSADFNTEYEWDKMTPTYSSSSSVESRSAVAKLMYHVGVAVDMDYNVASGAYTHIVPKVLSTYFKYDKGMQTVRRNTYKLTDWINILKNELNESRAVVYSGASNAGGHAFVCDGYDENNMFHINWGWGGVSNGYFQITALTPSTHGIGGGSADGYNIQQTAVIGIQKAKPESKVHCMLQYESMSVIEGEYAKNETVEIETSNIFNYSGYDFEGLFGLGLYSGDNLVATLHEEEEVIPLSYGYRKYPISVTIPAFIPNGDYQIRPLSKKSADNEYAMLRHTIGDNLVKYINVVVTANNVKYKIPTDIASVLSISNLEVAKMYVNRETAVAFDISNSGEEYYNTITPVLIESDNYYAVAFGTSTIINVEKGATTPIKFGVNFAVAAGSYRLAIINFNGELIGNPIPVTINAEPAKESFILTKSVKFADNNNVPKNDIQFFAQVKNNGGYYAGKFMLAIFNSEGHNVNLTQSDLYTIDENQTVDVAIKGSVDLDNGVYLAMLYYVDGNYAIRIAPDDLNIVQFNLTDPVSGVNGVDAVKMTAYPNPVLDQLNIVCETEIVEIHIFDISGRLVAEQKVAEGVTSYSINMEALDSGNYFVQIITADGMNVKQIIKK